MKINKDFPGLEDMGGWYKYTGDIITKESIEIRIGLVVTGSINAGGSINASEWITAGGSITAGEWITAGRSIEAGEWIKAGRSIEAGEWITAGRSIEAGEWIKAGRSIEAGGSIKAGEWITAGGSITAGEWIEMYGITTSSLFLFHGTFRFTVFIMDTHIKIGCQLKSKDEWREWLKDANESKAKSLGDNGSMWAMRDMLARFL